MIKLKNKLNMDLDMNQRNDSQQQLPEMVHDIKIENYTEDVQNVKIEVELESFESHDNVNNTPLFACKKELPEYSEIDGRCGSAEAYPLTGLPVKEEFVDIKHEVFINVPVFGDTCDMNRVNTTGHIPVGNNSTPDCTQTSESTLNKISEIGNNGKNSDTMGKYELNKRTKIKGETELMNMIKYRQKVKIDNQISDKELDIEIIVTPNFEEDQGRILKKNQTIKRKFRRPNVDKERKNKKSAGKVKFLTEKNKLELQHTTEINNIQANDMKSLKINDDYADKKFRCDIFKFTSNEKSCIGSHVLQHTTKMDAIETAFAESKTENKRSSVTKTSKTVKAVKRKSSRKLNKDIKAKKDGLHSVGNDFERRDISNKEAVHYGLSPTSDIDDGEKSITPKLSKGKRNFKASNSSESKNEKLASKRIGTVGNKMEAIDRKHLTVNQSNDDRKPIHVINKLRADSKFICDLCNYGTNNKKCIESHVILHSGKADVKNIFTCFYCGYITNANSNFVKHMRTHTGEKPYSCSLCEFKCGQRSYLVTHMRTHTGEKPFACNICDYKCCRRQHLVCHMRTHTGEKPFSCSFCSFKCSYKEYLVKHVRIHTGEKRFCCTVCNNRFAQKIHLDTHMRTHTGEKPFSCTMCEFKCVAKSYLVIHMRTHTGEKPFSCNVCSYRCNRKQSLIHHNRTHTGEKPYGCSICDKKFGQRNSLRVHMNSHNR